MARTLKVNLTARAASTERRDIIEHLRDLESEEQKKIHETWEKMQDDAIQSCIALEGEEAFLAWYMNDDNVPDFGRITERIAIIRAHLAGLEFNAGCTMADALVGDECANVLKIADVAESISLEEANG